METQYAQEFFTQKELAQRWKVSQSTIKNWRDQGNIPFFRLPGSTKILYPVKEIEFIEAENTIYPKGGDAKKNHANGMKMEKPIISDVQVEWRI